MTRNELYLSAATVICALGESACAESALNLRPAMVERTRGAAFGRVTGFKDQEDVTGSCRVIFTGADKVRKKFLALDKTGWIFTGMDPGTTYLSGVSCGFRRLDMKELRFDVPGAGKIAYFGHLRVVFPVAASGPSGTEAAIGAAFFGGVIGAAASGPSGTEAATRAAVVGDAISSEILAGSQQNLLKAPDPWYHVSDGYDEALAEYRARYGADASALQPVVSIVPGAPVQLKPAPATLAGFSIGEHVVTSEASCTGAGLVWQKLDDGQFSCSKAPVDLGVPATVKLTTCAQTVSRIMVNANSDRAAWSALTARLVKLSRFFAKSFGDSHSRDTNSLDDCNEEIKICFAKGRARTSETWRWREDQSLTLRLDGGPPGSGPSLTVVHDATALCRARSGKP